MMKITTKTGRPVNKFSSHKSEVEVIGMPGTKYRIKSITKNPKASYKYGGGLHPGQTAIRPKVLVELEEI
jgi:hypothetical protein